jgi:molybdopterin-containing oxidoreductase family iron-sulfur binding subunit
MSSVDRQPEKKAYWRSLAELENTPQFRAFMESEFPAAADPQGLHRRRWLQLMGASIAFAGVAGCRWQQEEILPFDKRPEGRIPGEPRYYTTAMDFCGDATGLVVTTVDGRPIKVEGSRLHPFSLGATNSFAQAAILELYDPDRSRFVIQRTGEREATQDWSKFAEFAKLHFQGVTAAGGAGFCVLSEATSSPTVARLRQELQTALPTSKWFEYEPVSDDNERAGTAEAFGRPLRPQLAPDRADVILCLDADLLGSHPAAVRYARQFAGGRSPARGRMNRLYAVESGVSITGAAADHRLPLRSSQIAGFVVALRGELAHAIEAMEEGEGEPAHSHSHAEDDAVGHFAHAVAADLAAHRGQCLIVAGPQQPAEVHAEVHRLNSELDNIGQTVSYQQAPDPDRPSHVSAIKSLTQSMQAGEISTLLIIGGNPVYNAPADVAFATALEQVETTIHLGHYRDETGRACVWHLPRAHFLESWGDARAFDGTYSVVQPMIRPLHGGRSPIEVLAAILGDPGAQPEQAVRKTFREMVGPADGERLWRRTLHDGMMRSSEWPAEEVTVTDGKRLAAPLETGDAQPADLEISFCPDASLWDGRFANSGWLQECPRPLTKLTWDNAAVMAPATAKKLGVEFESVVTLTYRDQSVKLPVYVLPGQAPGTVSVALGYGRTAAGRVGGDTAAGIPSVGVNAYQLRTTAAMDFDDGLKVDRAGGTHRLATTQDHHAIDTAGLEIRQGRIGKLVREATLEHYQEHPDFAQHVVHHPPLESLWEEHEYPGHRWGMSIDLSKCIGCNACVVACQAENNIPVVGKDQVLVGREMHWIRVDRYFRGDVDDPRFALQPLTCHHCELAPCEQVCPVNATVHSREGLNDMVYNRCVGTRYCANNCPYKVRRFNYFDNLPVIKDAADEVVKLKFNPEVTVRSRGVMEKCTYCVQRIQNARIKADNAQRGIEDGEIQTACQQVCPTQAIVFGDLADIPRKDVPNSGSKVWRQQQLDRAYALLGELNVKPRTMYLARIRNPNPELDGGHEQHDGHTHG